MKWLEGGSSTRCQCEDLKFLKAIGPADCSSIYIFSKITHKSTVVLIPLKLLEKNEDQLKRGRGWPISNFLSRL